MVLAPPRALTPSLAPTLTRALTRPRRETATASPPPPPPSGFTYLRTDGTSSIFRPDGSSLYIRH
jgi:hypothetical protein